MASNKRELAKLMVGLMVVVATMSLFRGALASSSNDSTASEPALPDDFSYQTASGEQDAALNTPSRRINQHRELVRIFNSLEEVPRLGVRTEHEAELVRMLSYVGVWNLNIFDIHRLSHAHSLTVLAFEIFKRQNLLQTFNIPERKFLSYLMTLEAYYLDIPYHNSIHAAEVLYNAHILLSARTLRFSDIEILSVLFAAIIHDVDHPGYANSFLIATGHQIAQMYNDESPLENHSLAVAFRLLQEESLNFLENLDREQRQAMRQMVVDLVLSTDSSKHRAAVDSMRSVMVTLFINADQTLVLDSYSKRIRVLRGLIHCADLGNPTKPLNEYRRWIERLTEEFHVQGDLLRSQNLRVPPLFDRYSQLNPNLSQVQFIDLIAMPAWTVWNQLVGGSLGQLEQLRRNREWFEAQIGQD